MQFNVSVCTLRSDNAWEYLSHLFQAYIISNDILHQTSYIDTHFQPSLNGIDERKNRHFLERAQALLFHVQAPILFWANAVSITYFLKRFLTEFFSLTNPCFLLNHKSLKVPILFEMSYLTLPN